MKKSTLLALPSAILAAASLLSAQSTLYVSPTGNNANPGDYFQPYLTINAAIAAAQPGDTINVMEGVYQEHVWIDKEIRLEALPQATIQYTSDPLYPDACVHIDGTNGDLGSGLVVTGFEFQGDMSAIGVLIHDDASGRQAHNVSPVIQDNVFVDCIQGVVVHCHQGISEPEIRFNHITSTLDETEPILFGIEFWAWGGVINATTRCNQIEKMEIGIAVNDMGGTASTRHENDAIQYCEWGTYTQGPGAHSDFIHLTVAHGRTFSTDSEIKLWGVFAENGGTADVYNSIVWIPDWLGPDDWGGPGSWHQGVDINDPSLITVDNFTTVQDYSGALDPKFVDVANYNLRLQSDSPAIDAADLSIMMPTHVLATPFDNDWNPRVLDGDISDDQAAVFPDRGAYEYTVVDLDFRSTAYPNYSPSGKPYPQIRYWDPMAGLNSLSIDVKGPAGALYFVWIQGTFGQTNDLGINALGNMQLLPLIPAFTSGVIPGSGVATLTQPVYLPQMIEGDLEAQAVVVTDIQPTIFSGAFTRRIELEVNN